MAKPQYSSLQESDFSRGMDTRSAESSIREGYVEDLQNGEVIETGVRKRVGYQGYAGNLPVRVESIAYLGGGTEDIELTLGSGIDLTDVHTTPIVVYGRTSTNPSGTNDFEMTDAARYYDRWLTKIRKTFTASTTTAVSISAAEHGLSSRYLYVDTVQSSSAVTRDYTSMLVDSTEINETTYAITTTATVADTSDVSSFIFYSDKATISGESFAGSSSGSGTSWTVTGATTATHTITAAQHNLTNYNMLVRVYQDTGAQILRITPDSVTVDRSTGEVNITITNATGSTITLQAVMTVVDTDQIITTAANGAITTTDITISSLTSPWVHHTTYSISGDVLTEVIPDSYSYDETTQTLTITITSPSGIPDLVTHYTYGTLRANTIVVSSVTGAVSGFSDDAPQLTVWGLDHNEIYGSERVDHQGWVSHIDAYRAAGEQRVVAGLGGVLHTAQTYDEEGTTYKMASLYPSLQGRVSAATVVGPLIYETGETPGRTRGYLTHSGGSENRAAVTSVVYDSNTGYTKYTLSLPGLSSYNGSDIATSLATLLAANPPIISVTSGYEDRLTIQDMPWSVHNGTFRIRAVDTSVADQLTLSVVNDSIDSTDYDDTGCSGSGMVYTDQIVLTSGISYFIPGDRILADGYIPDTEIYEVAAISSSNANSLMVTGIVETTTLGAGLKLIGRRTSSVMPLRDNAATLGINVDNLVAGDMVSYDDLTRHLRVLEVNSAPSTYSISITGDGSTATLTLSGGTTDYLANGRSIIVAAGPYSGVHTILEITSTTTLEIESTETASVSGYLLGCTATLDEELTWEDSTGSTIGLETTARWIPIEAPDDDWDLTPSTYIRHLPVGDLSDQSIARSTMVADNLYITNYDDEVMKFDGTSIYRTGLLPWQPGLFLVQDTSATGKIVNNEPRHTIAASGFSTLGSGNGATTEFKLSLGHQGAYSSGDRVYLEDGTGGSPAGAGIYTVISTRADSSNGYVTLLTGSTTVTQGSDASSAYLQKVKVYRYYYRLNAVDENNNIIASAVTGAEDHILELATDAAIYHRLVGFPVWDIYDYDKIELEIYRTKANTPAPFYKVTTLQCPFDGSDGYINFTDSFADDDLVNLDITTAIQGSNLGTGWSDPLPAKYVTSAGGSLVLGNIRDYPQLDVRLVSPSTLAVSDLNGKTITLRRDSTGSGTSTDMVDTAVYEFVDDSGEVDISADTLRSADGTETVTASSSGGDLLLTTAASFHLLVVGDPITFTTSTTLPTGLSTGITYYVQAVPAANTLKVATSSGGSAITYTDAGTGIHTMTYSSRFAVYHTAHGLAAKDWVYIFWDSVLTASHPITHAGWWQLHGTTYDGANNFVILKGGETTSSSVAIFPTRYVTATAQENVPVLLGESGGQDGNMGMFNGNSTFVAFQAMRKLAMAINATMRMCDTTLSGQTTFTPWLIARAGNEYEAGQLLIRQPRTESITPAIKLPSTIPTGSSIFVNGRRKEATDVVAATSLIFPSRVLVSYQNYPEIMDRPTIAQDSQSESAVDVNPSDGQEITGIIPFFGESAFGSAQQSGVVVIFKENSIYLLDIAQKRAGGNPIQKLNTRGLGCTAPYSIAPTKDGIMFANESGIYCLRQDLTVDYIGRNMAGRWTDDVNKDQLAIATGHHYARGNQYKLSLPTSTDTENSAVYVYDHTQEGKGQEGAWSRFTNHPSTGWLNLAQDAYMAATTGRVFSLRRAGDETDYRDDNEGIPFAITTRAINGGLAGIRKVWSTITSQWRTSASTSNTYLSTATDLRDVYTQTTTFRMENDPDNDGLSDETAYKVLQVQHNVAQGRKGVYLQINATNAAIDEDLELVGLALQVAPLSDRLIKAAADTTGT